LIFYSSAITMMHGPINIRYLSVYPLKKEKRVTSSLHNEDCLLWLWSSL